MDYTMPNNRRFDPWLITVVGLLVILAGGLLTLASMVMFRRMG